jgi:hypothetical protein
MVMDAAIAGHGLQGNMKERKCRAQESRSLRGSRDEGALRRLLKARGKR